MFVLMNFSVLGVIERAMRDNFNSTPHMLPAAGEVNKETAH